MRLTRDEIYIVVFVLAALVIGSLVKHYRHRAAQPPAITAPAVTPSAEE